MEKSITPSLMKHGMGIVLIDRETGYIIDCNPEFERQAGRNLKQLQEMYIWELRPPEKIEASKESFYQAKEKGAGSRADLEFQKPDGDFTHIDYRTKGITIKGKRVLLSMSRDITERKKAEEEIQKFRTITDSTDYGANIATPEGEFTYVNESLRGCMDIRRMN